jgi:hypothetical protein
MPIVTRFAQLFLVALLVANLGGAVSLFVPEPCGPWDVSSAPDNTCPPTCVRCGCCGQPLVTALAMTVTAFIAPIDRAVMPQPRVEVVDPHEILHVPKIA